MIRSVLLGGSVLISLIWLVTDPRPLTSRFKDYLRANRLIYIFAELYLIMMIIFPKLALQWPPLPMNQLLAFAGSVLFCFGVALAIWAKLTMKRNWGPPLQHELDRQSTLVTGGPFKYSRNPIYVGLIVMFFGVTLALHSYLVILGFAIAWYFSHAVKKEEALLAQYFGQTFQNYRQKTPRFFGPF